MLPYQAVGLYIDGGCHIGPNMMWSIADIAKALLSSQIGHATEKFRALACVDMVLKPTQALRGAAGCAGHVPAEGGPGRWGEEGWHSFVDSEVGESNMQQ